ncbi:hypothetical protein H2200_010187 [Cladophialophora chaetospira]|uniref:Uncharacterized protein n=1 Tax=Cladophialophora chaetospira TaxID=386627 RepID=A0AA38X2I2_9EURO|nr:hypothetical protein H2200_010187 [Cladophialophora chaetospira]
MFGNNYSHVHTGDLDDYDEEEIMFGDDDNFFAAAGLGRSARRIMSSDPTGGFGAYLASRDRANGKTFRDRLSGKCAKAGKKSSARRGRTYRGVTKPLKSVTSNAMHNAVFPNMRVPVYMRKSNGKKNHSASEAMGGSGRGISTNSRGENLPVMSVQCPMPGGTSVTVQTDPVEKVSWGPAARIEATGHAKDLVKQLREAAKISKTKIKAKAKAKEDEGGEAEDEGKSESVNSSAAKEFTGAGGQGDSVVPEGLTVHCIQENVTPETSSPADTEAATDNLSKSARRGFRAPPATPGDVVLLKSPYSDAAMSMPTLPTMHHIADTKLVENFRLLHAKDPEAFENMTREIKQGLIDAKIKRGGLSFLLREEYTVELASREGAEIAEKWAKGQGKNREHPGLRSRGNSLNSQPSTGSLRIRGGDMGEPAATTVSTSDIDPHRILEHFVRQVPNPSPASLVAEGDHGIIIPPLNLQASVAEEPTTVKPAAKETKKNSKDDTKSKLSVKEIKKALSRLNIAENVTKVTTYGSVRHQSTVKREATDHGEKRTVKTWIEITEVYDVPKPQKLTVKDIVAAVEQEQEDEHGSGSEWESDSSDSDSDSDPGEKAIKAKKASADTYDSSSSDNGDIESDSDSASDHGSVHDEDGYNATKESGAESLLRSLNRLGEDVGAENLTRLGGDFSALIAGLSGEGLLRNGTDGNQTIGW